MKFKKKKNQKKKEEECDEKVFKSFYESCVWWEFKNKSRRQMKKSFQKIKIRLI